MLQYAVEYMIGPTLRAGLSGRRLFPAACQSAQSAAYHAAGADHSGPK
jgi:hypothetical protein